LSNGAPRHVSHHRIFPVILDAIQKPRLLAGSAGEMVMAGLRSSWRNPGNGEEMQSCTVLTCAPNEAMAEIHNSMPS